MPCERPLKEPTEEVSLERSHPLVSALALSEKKKFNVSFKSVNMKGLVQNDRKKSVVQKVKRMYANLDKKKAKGSQVVRCNWG